MQKITVNSATCMMQRNTVHLIHSIVDDYTLHFTICIIHNKVPLLAVPCSKIQYMLPDIPVREHTTLYPLYSAKEDRIL